MQPTDFSDAYLVRIKYERHGLPKVRILAPEIKYNSAIHMYADRSLCLYHPESQPWSESKDLHRTILPWTAEWLIYYELFLDQGKWLGPEIAHGELTR